MGDAFAVVAIAASLRLDDPELEARRMELLRTAVDLGQDASDAIHAWVHQLRSEYRGSSTAWNLDETSARLHLELDRFDAEIADVALRLRELAPEAIEQVLGARAGGGFEGQPAEPSRDRSDG